MLLVVSILLEKWKYYLVLLAFDFDLFLPFALGAVHFQKGFEKVPYI
jgi:hypothetical protein